MKSSKAAAKLERRRKNYDESLRGKQGFKRPGSVNKRKAN